MVTSPDVTLNDFMKYCDWSSKLEKILEQTDKETLYDFMRSYAETNQDLALALIEQFDRKDSDDAKAMVEQCFMHPSSIPHFGTSLNWYAISEDLAKVYDKAVQLRKQGDDLGAALIGRYMLTQTWLVYMEDHPNLELTRGEGSNLYVHETLDMLRELLIEGDIIDFDTRKGLLKEIEQELSPIRKKDWLGRLDWFLDDAKTITMTRKGYIGFITRKITSSYGAFRWDYAEKLVRYLLKHDELDEAHKAAQTYDSGGKAMVLLIAYLTEHQLYDEAIETNLEVKDTFTRYSNKLDEKLVDVLRRQGDKNKLIDTCRLRFLEAEYRWTYYEALKEAVPSKEWSSFLQHLLSDCDFHMDCDETQLRLYRAEKLYDKFFPYFMKNNYVEVERWAQYGGLMTEEEQLQVADKLSDSIVEMAKRQNKRRDYRFVAEHVATFMKASPIAKEKGQELISRIMDAVPGRPALYDELMKI